MSTTPNQTTPSPRPSSGARPKTDSSRSKSRGSKAPKTHKGGQVCCSTTPANAIFCARGGIPCVARGPCPRSGSGRRRSDFVS
ncbi:hypothetical protein PC116_g23720 [Phytophthora cactorum]|uniref:Uncharacterized protein n=1 Tax=Phytophthora cactorum TaxID=29920 RepID=A0A8T1BLV3_9STRA|nr:hypothetical protein Pcac1_g4345 [Phytophthora cactorum]KAG2892496.1 hypothetical protein PC114_g16607 [Phytophthora cactorum]KAG2903148.1 hypothetical protein PC117_g21311 [Phytophthora cactorum]KAG3028419.1 hypothetical protein PC119_g7004 [Phytophthora cactorum]KAG3190079.1 hypothetical protein PC128_g11471 [Phytophthora cactorum]